MSKKAATKVMRKVAEKVIHPPYLKTNIPAGQAVAAPPLGPQLGQRGIQIGPFCKQFNEITKDIKPGIPIPTFIELKPDRSVGITCYLPPNTYFLKMAAGATKGTTGHGEVAGILSLKHIYEIAKIKSKDQRFLGMSMENICKSVIGTAHSLGIKVVPSLEAAEYADFLEERKERLKAHEENLEEIRKSKLLRF
ncbi:54S ribosomal protein L11 [Mactra antiquata]